MRKWRDDIRQATPIFFKAAIAGLSLGVAEEDLCLSLLLQVQAPAACGLSGVGIHIDAPNAIHFGPEAAFGLDGTVSR